MICSTLCYLAISEDQTWFRWRGRERTHDDSGSDTIGTTGVLGANGPFSKTRTRHQREVGIERQETVRWHTIYMLQLWFRRSSQVALDPESAPQWMAMFPSASVMRGSAPLISRNSMTLSCLFSQAHTRGVQPPSSCKSSIKPYQRQLY